MNDLTPNEQLLIGLLADANKRAFAWKVRAFTWPLSLLAGMLVGKALGL